MNRYFIVLGLLCLMLGCNTGPNYQKPDLNLPDKIAINNNTSNQEHRNWWDKFNDPDLNILIEQALHNNSDILTAMTSVSKAQVQLNLSEAERLPEISLNASASRTRNSKAYHQPFTKTPPYNFFSIAPLLNYQVDLWGKVARSNEAGRAQLLASKYNQEIVKLTIASELAKTYFKWLAIKKQLILTTQLLEKQQKLLGIKKQQQLVGKISFSDFLKIEASVSNSKSALPSLEQQKFELESAIAILIGNSPKQLFNDKIKQDQNIEILPIVKIKDNLSSTILEQRPDVKAAEQLLIASNAKIGMAKADYFPTISLSALIGLQSIQLSKLFSLPAGSYWQENGEIAGPLIDFGRTKSRVRGAELDKELALIKYTQTLRNAFQEVRNAISAQKNLATSYAETAQTSKALKEVAAKSELRYKAGLVDWEEVTSTSEANTNAQILLIKSKLDSLTATVDLYKSLGGCEE